MKRNLTNLIILLVISFGLFFAFNSYFGWYGYEKWKMRRSTFGNINESKNRDTFIKELKHDIILNDSLSFNFFIERGFYYCRHSSGCTSVISESDSFPYQISFPLRDKSGEISFRIKNKSSFDSIFNNTVLLKQPLLLDTLILETAKFDKTNNQFIPIDTLKFWN